jgi:glycosyltransferase involved in cell wall biosynthesis
MTKTILIITDNLPEQINGVVTTYKNIEAQAVANGYRVDYLDPSRFPHINAPRYPEVKLSWVRGIGKKIEEIQPDHIHIATEGPLGLAGRLWCDRKGITYNTAYHTKFPEGLKKLIGLPEPLTWRYIRWFHKHSGKVLTTTNSMVQELFDNGLSGPIVPWTRGVDRSIFHPAHRGETVAGRPILVCVSRVSKEKNLEKFFEMQYPGATKIMVGDGPMLETYKKQYPDVIFTGFKTGASLAEYYANADVFVFPSQWETFGIVMIEAMACGTPVAAYPCQGPEDVVDEGVTGCMNEDLKQAVKDALMLDRTRVWEGSSRWSWEEAWKIFEVNLIKTKWKH